MRLLLIFLSTAALCAANPKYLYQKDIRTKLLSPKIDEASGLVVSPSSDDFFWLINDSGGTPEIHLSETNGTSRGALTIRNAKNIDWEDLAAFTLHGVPHLLIADTGDNRGARNKVRIIVVKEPKLPTEGKSVAGEIPIAWEFNFTYEDGPKDCEAVAVDAQSQKIILLSKRTTPPQVYELPLKPKGKKQTIARKIGTTEVKAPALSFIPFRNQPTGMDISRDGKLATVITYYGVFVFPRANKESWAEALQKDPIRVGAHRLFQAESIAFSHDANTIYCVSEGLNSPIIHFQREE